MMKRTMHVGLSVTNLERSVEFYKMLLGGEVLVQEDFSGKEYEEILSLHGARGRVALVGRNDIHLELFEFSHPTPKTPVDRYPVCNHGITHFCIEVTDLGSEYDRLKSAGVVFHCPPLTFFGTAKATYGRDPDGNAFELLELLNNAGT
jgi:catechol 2,3-dioxygenase-like lactoylglutathione lyase family enzyme